MTRVAHHLRHWPYYLAFAVLLVMVDPVAAGIAAVMTGEITWGGAHG